MPDTWRARRPPASSHPPARTRPRCPADSPLFSRPRDGVITQDWPARRARAPSLQRSTTPHAHRLPSYTRAFLSRRLQPAAGVVAIAPRSSTRALRQRPGTRSARNRSAPHTLAAPIPHARMPRRNRAGASPVCSRDCRSAVVRIGSPDAMGRTRPHILPRFPRFARSLSISRIF